MVHAQVMDGTRRTGRRRRGRLGAVIGLAAAAALVCGPVATTDAAGPAWFPMGTGLYDTVNDSIGTTFATLAVGTSTYVGGQFTDAGGVEVNNIAMWDGTAFHALGDPATDGPTDSVWSLATDGTTLFVGGPFGVMAWDIAGQAWDDLTAPDGVSAYALQWYDDGAGAQYLVLGGEGAGGTCRLLAYEGAGSWSPIVALARTDNPCTVDALAQYGNQLVVGGMFDRVGGVPFASVALWNGDDNTWSQLAGDTDVGIRDYTDGGDEVGAVWALAVDDTTGTIYLGGSFDDAGGTAATNLVAWNAGSFTEIGDSTNQFDVTNDEVDTLAFSGGSLAVGGWFSLEGVQLNVAALQLSSDTWIPFLGGVDDAVFTITLNGALGQVYVGGMFSTAYSDTTPTEVADTGGIAMLGDSSTPPQITSISVTGTPTVGNLLTAHVATTGDPAPTVTLEWIRCNSPVVLTTPSAERSAHVERLLPDGCVIIDGATSTTYRLVGADRGKYIGVIALATNDVSSAVNLVVQQSPVAAASTSTTTPGTTTTTPDLVLPATGGSSSLPTVAITLLIMGSSLLLLRRRRRSADVR